MTYLGYKTTPHGCPYCLEPTVYEKYDFEKRRHMDSDGEGECPKCGERFEDEELITVHKEKSWKLQLISMNEMRVSHEDKFNDQQLTRLMLSDSDVWKKVLKLEDAGLQFRFEIDKINDYHAFVEAWLKSKDWFIWENKYGRTIREAGFEVVDCQSVPASSTGGGAGHPDFKIVPNEDDLPEKFKEEVNSVYIEFKYNGDTLSNSQFEWVLDAVEDDISVFVMRVEDISD